jgi:hypothetical protein
MISEALFLPNTLYPISQHIHLIVRCIFGSQAASYSKTEIVVREPRRELAKVAVLNLDIWFSIAG